MALPNENPLISIRMQVVNQQVTNVNPLVRISMHFEDGTTLQWVLKEPVPQAKAMAVFGHLFGELGQPEMPGLVLQAEEANKE